MVAAAALIAGCATSSSAHLAPSVAFRTCSGEVGHGGLRVGYRRRALIFGPLALGDLRTYTAREPLPGTLDGRYGAYEIIAIVTAGAQPVLSLPRSEWTTVGLIYDPNEFRTDGAYRIRDLEQVVRFRACRSPSFNHGVSQFDGGFVVSRPQCVHFTVTAGRRTYRGEFPAAAPCPRTLT
jgi:hypothetical protein